VPGKKDEAFKMATEMAVEAKMSKRSTTMTNIAVTLLNAAEATKPADRDKRLIDLAFPLLYDTLPTDLIDKPEHVIRDYEISTQRLVGYAFHLRGDPARATAAIREAMAKVKALKPPVGADEKQFAERSQQRVKDLEATLKEYTSETPPPADRR
jgi:hypothetical protein